MRADDRRGKDDTLTADLAVAHEEALGGESLAGESNLELLPRSEPWRSIIHGIGVAEQAIGSFLLLVILILVLAQVVQRYVPGTLPWTGEVARLAMVWMTFVMAGYLASTDRHITLHVVDYVARGRVLAGVKLFVSVFVLVTCLAMVYATFQLLGEDIGQVAPASQIPLRIVNAIPIVGFSLTALRAALAIVLVDFPALRGRERAA